MSRYVKRKPIVASQRELLAAVHGQEFLVFTRPLTIHNISECPVPVAHGNVWSIKMSHPKGSPLAETIINVGKCPYGVVGDHLWIKEAFSIAGNGVFFKIDHRDKRIHNANYTWFPARELKMEQSRFEYRIIGVRLCRIADLQEHELTHDGFIAVPSNRTDLFGPYEWSSAEGGSNQGVPTRKDALRLCWSGEFKKAEWSWYKNPFVWRMLTRKVDIDAKQRADVESEDSSSVEAGL